MLLDCAIVNLATKYSSHHHHKMLESDKKYYLDDRKTILEVAGLIERENAKLNFDPEWSLYWVEDLLYSRGYLLNPPVAPDHPDYS